MSNIGPKATGPLTPNQVGSGIADLAARAAQPAPTRQAQPAQPPATPKAPAAPAAPARMSPEEMFAAARARDRQRAGLDAPELPEEAEGELEPEDGPEPLTEADDDFLDELSDELAGKKPKAGKEKPADAEARKKALDRLKLPAALRKALEEASPEEFDAWVGSLVQDQGKTDDALGGRDRAVATLREELDALKAQLAGGKGKGATSSNAGKLQGDPSLDDAGDQDEDLAGLRDTDPELARALDSRDAKIKALEADRRKQNARLRELEARHEAEARAAGREVLKTAISTLQAEWGAIYPALNDLNRVRAEVAPRAKALLDAGLAPDLPTALVEAAHGIYSAVVDEDRRARALQEGNPMRQAIRSQTPAAPQRRRESTSLDASTILFRLKEQHPDWTKARLHAEAKRQAGTIVPDRPYIR